MIATAGNAIKRGYPITAKQVADLCRQLDKDNGMWYDNRPQDTSEGKSVCDVEYNNGLIKRTLHDRSIVYFGKELKGDDLIDAYTRA